MYDTFDKMIFTADEYVPTQEDLKEICRNLPYYMPFLLWIEETGYDTDENIEMRNVIKGMIGKQLILDE